MSKIREWVAPGVGALMVLAACEMMRFPTQLQVPPAPVPESTDAPIRVARLSYLAGAVSFRAAGTSQWAPALLNRPVSDGDELWTPGSSRAELELGTAAVRLNGQASLNVLDLDDHSVQFKLTQGTLGVRLQRLETGDTFEIDTPNAAVALLRAGDYRVDVNAVEDSTSITVRAGAAYAAGLKQTVNVYPLQQERIAGVDTATYRLAPAPEPDVFDEFSRTRDRCVDAPHSERYVSPDALGRYELDEAGDWRLDPVWGPVWTPRVAADWAPYRFGRWLWIEPWGWNWMDDAQWGFAPFHYGRWAFLDDHWSWLPGPRHVAPVYTPAAVVFVAGGDHNRGFLWMGRRPEVAWFPLGPREGYVPPYRCTQGYLTDINITNTTILDPLGLVSIDVTRQKYVNKTVPNAITAVPRETFVGGGPVGNAAMPAPPGTVAVAKVTGTTPPVGPVPFSLSPGMGSTTPQPPAVTVNRQVLVWRIPVPAPPDFVRVEKLRKGAPGQPLDRTAWDEMRRAETNPRPDVRPVQDRTPGTTSDR